MMQEESGLERLPAGFTRELMTFFEAVRANDAAAAARLIEAHPALIHRRYAHREGPWREGTWGPAEAGEAGDTALHFAAFRGYAALAGALLDRGAAIDTPDHDGRSPLELAAWEGGAEVLRLLLERGADVSAFGAKALYAAAEHFAADRCNLLLATGAEPDIHTAIMLGMPDTVRALLDADPSLLNARDKRGRTPMDVAAEWNNPAIAELLIAWGAEVNLVQAAGLRMLDRVKALLAADPGAANPKDGSRTPLMAAAQGGHVAVIDYLLSQGADVHLGQVEYVHRVLPIHVAAAGAVDALVAAGADVNVPYRGFTPLARALSRGDTELAEALRRHGGKVEA
jgi:ankyrin repeat protein